MKITIAKESILIFISSILAFADPKFGILTEMAEGFALDLKRIKNGCLFGILHDVNTMP